jgi:predicted nucleic acid-binding protein
VKQAADSSITIAALIDDHPAHDIAAKALADSMITIAHVAAETYSVLTRLPPPNLADPSTAAAVLGERLPSTHATLSADVYAKAPARLAAAGVSGGATYDGLIALTAVEHDLELLTRDRRAVRSYRALNVRFTLVE